MRIKKITQNTRDFNITDAIVDGGTDLNEVTFNQMQDNIEEAIEDINIMTILLNDINPATIENWKIYQIPNYTLFQLVGDKLTFNNGIKIGKGVTMIKISGDISVWNGNNDSTDFSLNILKNGSSVASTYDTLTAAKWTQNTTPTYIINVKENDVISLGVMCGIAGEYRVYRGTLTVEVVK